MNDLSSLYQEVIIDHSKNPRNFHALEDFNHSATGHNPLCGDNLKIFAKIVDNQITELSFVGDGCAISKASASLLTELAKGKSLEEFQKLFSQFHDLLTTDKEIAENLGKLEVLAGVKKYPARVKCATLAWHTLDAALNGKNSAKTE